MKLDLKRCDFRRLKEERIRRGITREAFADKAGITKEALWKIETEQVVPIRRTVLKLARAFGADSVEEFLEFLASYTQLKLDLEDV